MNQKGKLMTCILCVMLVICCVLGFSSCKESCKNGHEWGEWSVTQAATCTETGIQERKCTKCERTEVSETNVLAHEWAEATCTSPKTCRRCSATEGSATGHTFDREVESENALKAAATCTTKAVYYKSCKCGAVDTNSENTFEVSAYGDHTFEKKSETPASCTEPGEIVYRCSSCGEETNVSESALGHKWVDATCTAAAYCSICQEQGSPALGHTMEYSTDESVEATCYADGKDVSVCTVCGEKHTDVLPKLAHDFGEWEPTDETPSMGTADVCHVVYTHACRNEGCAFGEDKEVEIPEHNFSQKITTAATCTQDGSVTYTCKQCGYEKADSYKDATAHNYVTNAEGTKNECDKCHAVQLLASGENADVNAADLKAAGSVKLDNASISLSDEAKGILEGKDNVNVGAAPLSGSDLDEALAALGTDYEGSRPTVYNFTMVSDGEAITDFGGKVTVRIPYTLSEGEDPNEIIVAYINGAEVEEVTARYESGFAIFETTHFSYYTVTRMTPAQRCAKFGHAERTVSQDPTCTTPGYTISICIRCGETTKKEKKEALGHDYEVTTVAATCTENGKETRTCKRCKDVFNTTLFAEGHDWTVTAKTGATCKNSGSVSYKCDKCSAEYTVTEPQKDHALKSNVVAPTCTERGYTEVECVNCDYEAVTDYVNALGHDEETKIIAPTCTEKGYTLAYCDRCGKEIKKTNEVAATGHNVVNGVCTVCGDGCEHNYVKGNVVEATCTANGYTVYACSKCSASYNGDEVKALGHKFNVEKCERCGIVNPELTDYYINMLRSVKDAMNLKVTLENFNVDVTSGFEIARIDNGEVVYSESDDMPDYLKQAGVSELALSVAENGQISGYCNVVMSVNGEQFTAKAVIKDGFAYMFSEVPDSSAGSEYGSMIGRISLESIFSSMSGGNRGMQVSYDMFKQAVVWANTKLDPVLESLFSSNKTIIGTAMAKLIPYAFERVDSEVGYTYTLDISKLKTAVDEFTADDLTISKAIDKIAGEGFFDSVALFAPVVLDKKPAEVIELAKVFGVDRKQICSAVDSLYLLVTGEKLDSSAYLDMALEQFKDMTIAEIIATMTEDTTAEDVRTLVSSYTKMMKETTIADLLFMNDENAERDENGKVTAEYKKAMLDGVKSSIDKLAEAMKVVNVSFSTGRDGFVRKVEVDAKDFDFDENIFGGGSSYDDNVFHGESDSEVAKAITSKKNTGNAIVNGKLTIELGTPYDDSVYASLVEQINGAVPSFGNNNVVTLNDSDVKSDADDRGVISGENKNKTFIYIDADGKITKMTTEGTAISRNVTYSYGHSYNSRYVYYIETETTYSIVYDTTSDAIVVYPNTECGGWKKYSVEGEFAVKGSTKRTLLKYKMANDGSYALESRKVLSNRKDIEYEWQYRSYIPSIFYFDSETKTFSLDGGHKYEIDEARSENKCGGKIVYVCENCGDEYVKEIDHIKDSYNNYSCEKEYEKLLDGDEYSCLDGVKVIERCTVCEGVIRESFMRGHPYDHNEHYYNDKDHLYQDGRSDNKYTHCEYTLNGKTCEDGITRKEICDICGKTVSIDRNYENYHVLASETEKYSLSEYGSKCGGYFAVYSCLCGEREERGFVYGDDEYKCDFDERNVECWITDESVKNKIVEGYQYNGIDGDVDFYNSYYAMTCAVTDSTVSGHEGPCGFKVRIARYWLRESGTCKVKRYYVVQLGYNESDGTYRKELVYIDDEAVCHSLKTLTDDETDNGYAWKCSICGSYKKSVNGTTTWVDKIEGATRVMEYTCETADGIETNVQKDTYTYSDNTTRIYTDISKYRNGAQIFRRCETKYRDGSKEWSQTETKTETYTDTESFGKEVKATKISQTTTDSNGRYEVLEYAYADYRVILNLADGVYYDSSDYYMLRYYDGYYYEEDELRGSMCRWWENYFKSADVDMNYLLYYKDVDGDSFVKYIFVYDEKPCTFSIYASAEEGERVRYYEYEKAEALKELLKRSGCETYEEVVEMCKQIYGIDELTEADIYKNFYITLPSENDVYSLCALHHFYEFDEERSVAPTCTQYGKAVYVCVVCGDEITIGVNNCDIISPYDSINPNGHCWTYVSENLYRCEVCGLENGNGGDGDVIFEDLTEKYGDGSEYVIGFHDRANEGFTVYVSLIEKNVAEGENNEIITDYEVSYDYDGKTVLKIDKAKIAEIALEKGLADGDYDVRVTFVPKNEGKDLDYAITLTDVVSSGEQAIS